MESVVGSDMFTYLAAHPEEGEMFSRAMSNMTGLVVADTVRLLDLGSATRDEDCIRIRRNCRRGAPAGARALVIEGLVGGGDQPGTVALLDMNMLATTDGRERDLAEFDGLFAASGWRRTGVRPTRSLYSLIEIEAI